MRRTDEPPRKHVYLIRIFGKSGHVLVSARKEVLECCGAELAAARSRRIKFHVGNYVWRSDRLCEPNEACGTKFPVVVTHFWTGQYVCLYCL